MKSAEYYREQAKRTRQLAKRAADAKLRAQLELTAHEYDEMAADADQDTGAASVRPPNC